MPKYVIASSDIDKVVELSLRVFTDEDSGGGGGGVELVSGRCILIRFYDRNNYAVNMYVGDLGRKELEMAIDNIGCMLIE